MGRVHIVGACVSGQEKEEDPEKKRIRQRWDRVLLTLPICSRGLLQAFSAAAEVGVILDKPVHYEIQTQETVVVFQLMENNIVGCC